MCLDKHACPVGTIGRECSYEQCVACIIVYRRAQNIHGIGKVAVAMKYGGLLHEVEAVVGVVVATLKYKAVEVAPIAKLCRCVDGILQSALRGGIEAQQLHACLVSLLGGAVGHKVLDIRRSYILVVAYILIAQELVVCLGSLFLKEVESLDDASTAYKEVGSLVYIIRS